VKRDRAEKLCGNTVWRAGPSESDAGNANPPRCGPMLAHMTVTTSALVVTCGSGQGRTGHHWQSGDCDSQRSDASDSDSGNQAEHTGPMQVHVTISPLSAPGCPAASVSSLSAPPEAGDDQGGRCPPATRMPSEANADLQLIGAERSVRSADQRSTQRDGKVSFCAAPEPRLVLRLRLLPQLA
jgi:hypothetical protein